MAIDLWCGLCFIVDSDSDQSGGGCAEVAAYSSQIGYPFFIYLYKKCAIANRLLLLQQQKRFFNLLQASTSSVREKM
jgi:hypothetical protein